MDKESIIGEARRLDTYAISIEPHDDCCSYLLPKRVETRARLEAVLEAEQPLEEDLARLEFDALDQAEMRRLGESAGENSTPP